jgi:type I restriction enzyme S subunit
VNTLAEPISATARVIPLIQAVELNPRPDRGSIPDDLDVSFVPMAAVEAATGRMDATGVRRFGDVKKGYTVFREGDVLFAKITPCMENGKMAVARGLRNGVGCGSTEFHVLRPKADVDPHYLYHFVSSARFRAEAAHHMTGAVGQKRVPAAFLEQCEIPLPDLDEQRRIVAELEKQFSRLDEAVANLKRAKANLRRHHAALLRAALEGKLVETESELAAREGRHLEPREQLIRHVFEVHREAWRGKARYIVPEHSVPADLPELPSGWTWIRFGLLGRDPHNTVQTGPFGAQLHNTEFRHAGVPVIAVGNLTGTGFTPEGTYFVDDEKAAQLSRYDVWAGDLLFARSGATLGKVCVAPEYVQDWRMTGHILRARLNTDFILPQIAVYAIAALPAVREQVFGSVRGVTRPGFNTSLLESIFVPVPPIAEQRSIVAEVDRRLSIVREVEAEVAANLSRAAVLRSAVIARAFSTAAD